MIRPEEFFRTVDEFVEYSGGDHVIKKVLVANNGIGALKAIRSVRKWCYQTFGDERMIKFVVLATPDDMKANAEFIRIADEVVDVPGGSNNNNYANVVLICEIAERLNVDAVMPLWGHASEKPSFPLSLLKCNRKIAFAGPPAGPMHALGDKIGSTIIAQSAGVPCIGWNGQDIRIDYNRDGLSQEIYDRADVKTPEQALECCNRIGYPVMIKASEGGGGKGIRQVARAEDVTSCFRQVQGEVPGSPIFIMRLATHSRHLEVQLIADKHGQAIALSGRDCSVQRRHQKIIEEGPPIAAPPDVFRQMELSAISLAKEVGYESLGTLEFLFHENDHKFSFLELNPRLQVEHPVTENILGINLPACQLQVAMGIPLHRIGDIRKIYGRHPRGRDTIDFEYAERIPLTGYCIAVRITAENPDSGFQPTSGKVDEILFRSAIDVWGYFSVNSSGSIHEFSDSQFGHIFAHGHDRESARRAMITALKELEIRGDMRTTVEYVIRMMESDDYRFNRISTQWLDSRIADEKKLKLLESKNRPHPCLVAICGAAVQGFRRFENVRTTFMENLRIGQISPKDDFIRQSKIELIYENVKYVLQCGRSGLNGVVLSTDHKSENISVRQLADGGYLLSVRGQSRIVYARVEGNGNSRLIVDGCTCIFTPEYDPTCLRASVAGKIARLLVPDGAHVEVGTPFVEIEVMKMYMPLKAEESGAVHFQLSEGAVISPGDLIARIELDHPDRIVRAQEFDGDIFAFDSAVNLTPTDEASLLPHLAYSHAKKKLEKVLDGYALSEDDIDRALADCRTALMNRLLPAYSMRDALSVLNGRIDSGLFERISTLNEEYADRCNGEDANLMYPSAKIISAIWNIAQNCTAANRTALMKQLEVVWEICEVNFHSAEVQILVMLINFVDKFLFVETQFDNMSYTDVVNNLRKKHAGDLDVVWELCSSHLNLEDKTLLILKAIDMMVTIPASATTQRPKFPAGIPLIKEVNARNLKVKLTELTRLRRDEYSRISFAANLALMRQSELTKEQRRMRIHEVLVEALSTGDAIGSGDRAVILRRFVESNMAIRDLFEESMHEDSEYQIAYIELYLNKIYQKTHEMLSMSSGHSLSSDMGSISPFITFEFKNRVYGAITASKTATTSRGSNLSFSDLASLSRTDSTQLVSDSEDGEASPETNIETMGTRYGAFAVFHSTAEFKNLFPAFLQKIPQSRSITPLKRHPVNALHACIMNTSFASDEEASAFVSDFLHSITTDLENHGIRRVTVLVGRPNSELSRHVSHGDAIEDMSIFTFRHRNNFKEDILFRYIEAPHAYHLDLQRLSSFSITLEEGLQTSSGNVQLYRAIPVGETGPVSYFARLVSFTVDVKSKEAESLFVEALDSIALAIGRDNSSSTTKNTAHSFNHIFLNILSPDVVVQPEFYEAEMKRICSKYSEKMVKLAVANVELKLTCRLAVNSDPIFIRLNVSNPTGFVIQIEKYYEEMAHGVPVFRSEGDTLGEWNNLPTSTPYAITSEFNFKRAAALASSDTLYAYDWPLLFEQAQKDQWKAFLKARGSLKKDGPPDGMFLCEELLLFSSARSDAELLDFNFNSEHYPDAVVRPVCRPPGENTIGMVGWLFTMKTPECRQGRQFVVIANDITHQAGSFGTKEDLFFCKASEYARKHCIPRLYLAANSGARIGMAQSLKSKFEVCWADDKDPSKGFQYIYLTKKVYDEELTKVNGDVSALPLICSPVTAPNGEERYVISDIIGEEADLGVENLMGSGLIAGETSIAYNQIFTLTLVVGRTVGIGAYLVRLGQRTIQKTRMSPIILTGFQALNKLMGREIYTTNDQLGGPMIMFPNGVTHMLTETHMESVMSALNWLAYVPSTTGSHLPILDITGLDTVDRVVEFCPKKGLTYDPRHLISGVTDGDVWESGFFDRDSFVEVLEGWAKTVVVGRARLGGIPIGVIITENRTSEAFIPADPADSTSREKIIQQAGGVWFPDSAYKTAQALRDFNRESLPCIVFANWRGFSGGQRDMFDEVLKFGSMIVDAFVAYNQPLFVYIPPFAELRGGAWVVVDHTINKDVMEFYAAEDARGGVLEAAGAASIKFRDREIIDTANRLDPVLVSLKAELIASKEDAIKCNEIKKKIAARQKLVMGVFRQIAVHFADLHDTPGRMQAKGVIRKQVAWAQSRHFFYWRLRRRLAEFDVAKSMRETDSTILTRNDAIATMKEWFLQANGSESVWEDDKKTMMWMQENTALLRSRLTNLKEQVLARELGNQLSELLSAVGNGPATGLENLIGQAMSRLSDSNRNLLKAAVTKMA